MPRFFHYFHQTFESWFEDVLGVPYPVVVNEQNLGFPTVSVETNFIKPLKYGNKVRVELELIDVGDRSITVRYTAVRLPDGATAATATIKTACVRNDTFAPVRLPAQWRDRFERHLKNG